MTESIELTVTVNGTQYPVRCDLPAVLKASTGRMSIQSAIEPSVCQLLERMVTILDERMDHPRAVVVDKELPPRGKGISSFEYGWDLKPSA